MKTLNFLTKLASWREELSARIRPVGVSYPGSESFAVPTERRARDEREMSERRTATQSGARVAREAIEAHRRVSGGQSRSKCAAQVRKANIELLKAEWLKYAAVLVMLFTIGVGNAWATTAFEETFASCDGTLGWSGSNANGTFTADNSGWTVANAYGAGGSARFGTGSKKGTAQTPAINCGSATTATLTFKAGAWNGGSEQTTLYLTYTNCSGDKSTVTMTKGSFTSYTVALSSISGNIKIQFAGKNASNSRFLLDDVVVTYTAGASYTVSYNANGGSGSPMANSTGASITISNNTYTAPAGKEFSSWNTQAGGGGTTYTAGQTGVTANLTLYAQWSCITPTISAHPSNGSCVQNASPTPLTVTASGGTLSYQWKQSTTSGGTYSNVSGGSGGTTASYTPPTGTVGTTYYKCVVTNTGSSCNTTATSNAASFTVSEPAAAATVHLENYSGSDPTGLHVGDSYQLPSSNSFSCGTKTFVGWSSVEIATPGSKPSSNYYEPGESATISSASMTFYAVFADASGGGGSSTVFSEDFSACTNTGGNDGSWSGSVASGTLPTSISSTWTTAYGYAADACIKLGSGSSTGSATTPSIDCGSATSATLTFKAGAWDNKDDGTTLSLTFTHCSGDKSSVTMVKGDWTSYEVALSNISDDITIQFSSTAGSKHRFFLDDVEVVTSGGGPTYSNYTTACASCSYQVTLSKTTPSNGSFTLSSADGSYENCTTGFSVTVSDITPVSGYVLDQVSESTGNSNISGPDGSGNYTVTYTADMDITSAISVTFKPVCATPTFSPAAGTYSSTQSVTISCATDDAVIHYTTDGSTPTASSPTYSSAITVSDDMTIKAIAIKTNYANSEVASAAYKIMDCDWYESFDECAGEGGNDGHFTIPSSIGNSSKTMDNDGWTFTNTTNGGGNKCIKLGTSSNKGTATTPSITVDNGATGKVKFRMAPWDTGKAQITLTGAEISSGVSTWESATNMTAEEWNDYTVNFTTTSTSLKITFNGSSNRAWLDEVCVKMDPAAYTVTFDANGHGTAPDPITDVAKNATISKPTPDPSANGWSFGGWYKEPACTNEWTWATDQVTSNTTLYAKWTCSNPTSLSISETNSKGDFCPGESMTLTVSGSNIGTGATYQWKKGGSPISGATSASYTKTLTRDDAGTYTCDVSNGSCTATSSGYDVKVWTFYHNASGSFAHGNLTYSSAGKGTITIELAAGETYEFKVNNNMSSGNWFGNTGTMTATIAEGDAWTFGSAIASNCHITAGIGGNYVFKVNYSDSGNPKVSVTYPTANQAANYDIWFDKSVVDGWNVAQTSDLFLRIGKSSNNKNNVTDDVSWSLVPGTDRFYTIKTLAYTGFEAWQIANNVSHSGNNSIYMVNGSGYAITKATDFQKYVVGSTGVTVVPTSSHNTSDGCNYWYVSKTDGMLTHTATITPPTNGTITIANAAQSLEATTTTADLPHRTILTVTATPDPGYELSTFTVTQEGGVASNLTSGATDNHILATNATFAATFSAKTINITWNGNGGTPSKASDTWVYDAAALASLPTATNGSKIFVGWFTDPSAGSQIDNVGGSNKPTDNVTYYAHWSDGNTVQFHAGVGSVTPSKLTQTTIGGAVAAFPTPLIDCEGWSFAGWKEGSAQDETTTSPEASLYAGGHTGYVPATATVHMYAVWKKTTGGVLTEYTAEGGEDYQLSNSDHVLEDGKPIKIVSDNSNTYSNPIRIYSGNSFTIKGATMSQIVFTMNGSYKAANLPLTDSPSQPGTYSNGTWTGSASSVTFKASAQVRVDRITVTYSAVSPTVTTWTSTPAGCVPMNQVKTPVISPDTEAQTGDVSVTITCATDDATIRYTTDGTNPTSSSGTVYSDAFTVSCSATVKAIAYKAEMDDSEIASQAYTITVPTPTFSLAAGTYYDANQTVTLSLPTTHTGTVIKYTTNGDDPSPSSTTYSSAITVTEGTTTIKAIGYNSSCSASSAVASATYIVRFGTAYTLVTDVDDLNAGDQIVMVSADATTSTHHAISTTINSNKRTATTDFNLNAGLTTAMIYPALGAAATVQTFTLGGEPDAWTFHETTNNGYLNCPSAGKLTNTATVSNSNKWTIAIASNIATIHNNEVDATIKSNTNAGHVFAAYGPATENVQLVKLYSIPNPEPVIKIDADLSAFSACRGSASDYQSFYISGKNLDGSIVLSNVAPLAGYEFCLTSEGTYTATLELTPVSKTVAKTQVFVRLAAGATAGTKNGNLNAAVSANSLSTNIAVTGSVSTADTYTDQIHNTVVANQCGEYLAPSCPDASAPADESCVETHFKFMGWITEADKNASGVKDDAWYIAHLITAGTAMTADGTNYYAVWAKEED